MQEPPEHVKSLLSQREYGEIGRRLRRRHKALTSVALNIDIHTDVYILGVKRTRKQKV